MTSRIENLKDLHYLKEKELPAINPSFYNNTDEYRIKKRKELYNPFDKSTFDIYSKCTLTNYDIEDPEKNINSSHRIDYTRKSGQNYLKENNKISNEIKDIFNTSKIDFLQDYKKDKEIDFNIEKNSHQEREKDDGLSRCYDVAHLDNDTDEIYKNHFLSTMMKDYTRKPFSKRDSIVTNNNLNTYGTIFRDNNELKEKKISTYENDYYEKRASNEPFERSVPANTQTHFKLEDYNCEIKDPYATEMNDNYKSFTVDRVIYGPDNLKYHFITDPDFKDNPFESSMKNDYKLYDKYHKEDPCEKQDKAQFELGHDINDNHTLYQDTYVMSNDKIKDSYQNSTRNYPNNSNVDNINFGTDDNDNTTTFRHDYRVNKAAKAKAYNDSRYVFNNIKEITNEIPLNLTFKDDQVKESLMHADYKNPNVEDKDKFKRVNPGTYDTNRYLKVNNNLGDEATDPKLSVFKRDYVNYPNKYKYNPRRPPNNPQLRSNLFKNDIYNDENQPRTYDTNYKLDYQKFDDTVQNKPYIYNEDFNTTLNEIFPKESRNYPVQKESVTHNNFNVKTISPIKRANKQEIEKEVFNIVGGDSEDKMISIAHSSFIAPEITIGKVNFFL
ncbi:hypothetical protein BCR36DRAFT_363712 [Piromyces finnis]|uniref:Uncharacterized protein n=1 Tax=Piromyces finnis TaxID=1754191 RepID=A0A1Y1UVW5_9FUNG|nr:hypothetical protein BCR36DRAFT_363712 [Piromyces finnis]|eukprot:ORX41756.1 hypothetical protein BCR36DRAFT_363712 [Piromyces finnis]